jgi:hypothetical protein
MPDGTILSIWGVGVWRGSGWQEIDGGTGVFTKHARLTQKKIQPANLL